MKRLFFHPYVFKFAPGQPAFKFYDKVVFGRHVRRKDEPKRVDILIRADGLMTGHIVPESVLQWRRNKMLREARRNRRVIPAQWPATPKPFNLLENLTAIEAANRRAALAAARA